MKDINAPLPVLPSFMGTSIGIPIDPEPAPKRTRASIKEEKARERAAMLRLSKVIGDLHQNASDPSRPEEDAVKDAGLLGQTVLKNLDLIVYALRIAGGAAKP